VIEIADAAERLTAQVRSMNKQIGWWIGLATCICGALLGQTEELAWLGDTARHLVTIAFILGTAASGYMLQRPADGA
jgi:hypothetical protein